MGIIKDSVRLLAGSSAHYAVRLATAAEELRAAQALRFQVFNLELNEGLPQSNAPGWMRTRLTRSVIICWSNTCPPGNRPAPTGCKPAWRRKNISAITASRSLISVRSSRFENRLWNWAGPAWKNNTATSSCWACFWKGNRGLCHGTRGRYLIGCSSLTSTGSGRGRGGV